jgi:hypothetical protein
MSSAWVLVYQWVTAQMLAGAEEAEPPPATSRRGRPPVPSASEAPQYRTPGRSPEPAPGPGLDWTPGRAPDRSQAHAAGRSTR